MIAMGRNRAPTYEELVAEEAQARAFEQYYNEVGTEGFLRNNDPLRTSRADFHDDEQVTAWRHAMEQLADKDNPSVDGLFHFLRLGKPLSARVAGALARLLRGGVVIPIEGPQPENIDHLPKFLGEVVVQAWPNPRTRKRAAHRPVDPKSWSKAHAAAAEVARRITAEPQTAVTEIVREIAEERHISPGRVGSAYEMIKNSMGAKNSK